MNELQWIIDFNPFKGDVFSFLDAVEQTYDTRYGRWYREWHEAQYGKHEKVVLTVATGGWSENEAVIAALLENFWIRSLFYESWQRGGKYVFEFYQPQRSGVEN
jgi:hypothetical protein